MSVEIPFGAIRTVITPEGEAPKHIRDAWVGVEIPCLYFSPGDLDSYGILSGAMASPGDVYVVLRGEAFTALERVNPEAVRWWRENGFPEETDSQQCFSFGGGEVEVIGGVFTRDQFFEALASLQEENLRRN